VVSLFGTYSGAIIRGDDDRRAMERAVRERLETLATDGAVEIQ